MTKQIFSLKSIAILVISAGFISCKKDKNSYFENMVFNEQSTPLAMLFSSSNIPPAGTYGMPLLDSVKASQISGIDGNSVNFLTLYPQVSDALYNPNAEKFLFRYNDSGDNSFQNFPSFVNNFEIFNYDTDGFKQSIRDFLEKPCPIAVGNVLTTDGQTLKMYIGLKYQQSYSKRHGVAVYIYRKSKISPQKVLPNDEVSNFNHKNILVDFVTPENGRVIVGNYEKDWENRYELSYNVQDSDVENIGVITAVFELDENDQLIQVVNSYSN